MHRNFFIGAALGALLPAAASARSHLQTQPGADPQAQNIIITASPFATDEDEVPTIPTKIARAQILQSGGASIADALKDVPGIAASGFASGASRPIIRGMSATRVRMLEDGTSSSDVSDIGPDHGVPIDPLSAQSIEVVRGAGTLRYGSQAIGGVVNAINNRVPMTLPTELFSGELNGSYASDADTLQSSALMDGKLGNLAVHADGFYRHADDYDTPLGTQQNSFFHGHGGSLGGSYFFDSGTHVGAAITQYDARYGIPSDTSYIDMRQTKVLTRSSFDLGSGLLKTLNIDGSYADYTHDEDEPDGTIATTFRNKEVDGHAELLFNPIGPVSQLALGTEVQNRRFSAVGQDKSYLYPARRRSEAGYVFTELPIGTHLHLQASGRVEHVELAGTPRSDLFTTVDYTPVSGAIGALYDLGKVIKLGFTASSTGRAPAITELFARGGHDGPDTYETGDPTLHIERANSLEGTLRVRAGPAEFDGSVYSSWFNNYIYGDLTGRTCTDQGACIDGPGNPLKELFYRQQGAHFRGLEGKLSYDLIANSAGKLKLKALADYVRATFDDGSDVPRIPPYRAGGGLSWSSHMVDAGFLGLHVGRQDEFGAYGSATPGYFSLDSQIAWRPFRQNPKIEIALVGHNLTNSLQRDAAAINKEDVVQPGRDIRLMLKVATF